MSALAVFAILAALAGIIGSIIPGIPGPPLSWIGLLLAYFAGGDITSTSLLVWLGITTLVTIMDYFIPSVMTRFLGGHKAASTGALIGLFVGMVLPPVGIIVGSIAGAFLAELLFEGTSVWGSAKAAAGAFMGFLLTTGLKLIVSGLMLYYTFAAVI